MKSRIKMPKVADSVDDVVVSEVRVRIGQAVSAGDALLLVETDKAQVEVPSPVSGIIIEILVAADQDVSTGDYIAEIDAEY
jgi:pyruvate/2-oxoglutarate dehydrogenase complex dihydrolipoamide acyltransferase (E2) component